MTIDIDAIRARVAYVQSNADQCQRSPGQVSMAGYAAASIDSSRDVPVLLAEVDRLRAAIKKAEDDGYIRGLRKAAQWARSFDQPLPKFDRPTCVQMANGLTAMAESAEKRLRGVESVETAAHRTTVKQNPPDATSASIGTPVGYAWECVCGASQTYDLADGRWGYPLSEDAARRLGSQHVTDARR